MINGYLSWFLLGFVAAALCAQQRSSYAMRPTPISSRRRCNHASFVIDEDVVISALFLVNRPLGIECSGAGSPAASTQENADLAEVTNLVAHQSTSYTPTFHIDRLEEYIVNNRHLSSKDNWIIVLIGKSF